MDLCKVPNCIQGRFGGLLSGADAIRFTSEHQTFIVRGVAGEKDRPIVFLDHYGDMVSSMTWSGDCDRTFSRRCAGDSKALERLEGPVARLLRSVLDLPPAAKPREALRTIGLEKFAPPLLVSGCVSLAGADGSAMPVYFGLPPDQADRLRFDRTPAYLLTIENFASFNRHVLEADVNRIGTTIYVGGYPSLATQQALGTLVSKLPSNVPIFHWSDIDPDGTWIFRTVEAAVHRKVIPHLMSPELAERHGRAPTEMIELAACPETSGVVALVEYLRLSGAKILEQEAIRRCHRLPLRYRYLLTAQSMSASVR
jgi:hypothetical protein